MHRLPKILLAFAAALLATASVGGVAYGSDGPATPTEVMSGLDNPRGLTFARSDAGWALYVAEAGSGGPAPCTVIIRGPVCVGLTGAVSRLRHGRQERVVEGLPSYAPFNAANAGAVGPSDVSFADGRGFVSIGLAAPVDLRASLGEKFGWIAGFDRHGNVTYEVDVSAYEKQRNPDLGPTESNPNGLLAGAGRRVVADAAGNSLLGVSPSGSISTLAVFPSRFYPQAGSRATDAVPDAVATTRRDGAYYVGELTGVPFTPELANIWRVVPGQAPQVYCSGFSYVIDLAFDRRGDLYVLENASGPNGPFLSTPGKLLRVGPDCTRTEVATGLQAPTSVAIGPDGDAYVTVNGTSAGIGRVVRFDLRGRPCAGDDELGDD